MSGYESQIFIEGDFKFSFIVEDEYRGENEFEIDPSTGNTIRNALAKAENIVNSYSSKSDLEKLYGYKNEICQMVDYNQEAVDNNQKYGNPWQLIWVFDDNASTNVVCEGYSKAFQYLCDLTNFENDDICAYTVTGTMNGGTGAGNHMWNVVRMDDYKNYLVDVTNCDTGSIGEDDKLFLIGTENGSGSVEEGYTLGVDGYFISYVYDLFTKKIYKDNELELADEAYSGPAQYSPTDGMAYAVLKENGDLVFFRSNESYTNDTQGSFVDIANNTYTGIIFNVSENGGQNVSWSNHLESIKKVYVVPGQTILPVYMQLWFNNCVNLISFDAEGFDTRNVTNMGDMFAECENLEQVDLSGFNTSSVTNMSGLFANCSSLKKVDLSGFDTSKVANFSWMFLNCSELKELNLGNFITDSATSMQGTFDGCTKLQALNISHFNVERVTTIGALFGRCSSLKKLDLSHFKTSSVKDMNSVFNGCTSLEYLDISGFETAGATMTNNVFKDCDSLKTVVLGSGFTYWPEGLYLPAGIWSNESQHLSESELASRYPEHASEWKGTWVRNIVLVESISTNKTKTVLSIGEQETIMIEFSPEDATNKRLQWSSNDSEVATVDEDGVIKAIAEGTAIITVKALGGEEVVAQIEVKVRSDKNAAYAVLTSEGDLIFFRSFETYENGKEYTVTDINDKQYQGKVYSGIEQTEYVYFSSEPVLVPWYEDRVQIKRSYVADGQTIRPLSLSGWFLTCTSLTDVDLNGYDTSAVKDMSGMFTTDYSLTYIDLSPLNTQNVTTMYWLFRDCKNLTGIVFDNDTSKVTDMGGMLSRCNKLETVDISSLDSSSLTDISGMFAECHSLRMVDFGEFNTASVTDMSWLFQDCTNLREIDLSSFETSSVENLIGMFRGCSTLESIDISSFNTSNVARMANMFQDCDSLNHIKLGAGFTNWTSEAYLPSGNWTNGDLVKNEVELYEQYPGNASDWNGEWSIAEAGFQIGDLYDFTYSPSIKSYVYDSDDIRVYYGNKLLTLGTDYTVKYANNTKVPKPNDTKLPGITITGKGNYTGTLTKNFDIKPLSLNEEDVIITLNKTSFLFNGKVQRPSISSIEYKGVKLKNKTDYVIEGEIPSSVNVGTYSFDIKLQGNYEGTLHASYRIINTGTPVSSLKVSSIKTQSYDNGNEIRPSVRVSSGKTPLIEGKDYTLEYKDNKDAGIAYVIITGSEEEGYYGTITKSFKITPVSLSSKNTIVDGIESSYTYTGKAIEPSVIFKYGDKTLVEDQDYTITYKNNIKAGKATVTLKGINNCKGTVTRTFTIDRVDLEDNPKITVSLDASYRYEKGGVKPLPVITYDGKTLVYNTDYTLSYRDNTKPGLAAITIKGKGNYTGTLIEDFAVISKLLYDESITVQIPDKVYSTKANGWKSSPVLTDSNGKKLSAGSDYSKEITYTYVYDTKVLDGSSKLRPEIIRRQGEEVQKSDILPVNTMIKVTINTDNLKLNNYIGTVAKTYRIVQADLSKASVTIPVKYYTGRPVTLSKSEIVVKLGKQVLSSSDYDIISYQNNTAKGTAKVTIKGKGNYGGYKTISFKINQRSLGITIHFDGNGAISGSMKDQIFYKDGKLNKNTFKNGDCEFKGWNTEKDGSGTFYTNQQIYDYDPEEGGRTITLYAIWNSKEGKVLNVWTWNTEFWGFLGKYYADKVIDAYTLKKGDVTIKRTTYPSDGGSYQEALDAALQNQDNAAPDEKVDIFLSESDYIKKYTNSKYTLDVSSIGVNNLSNAYQFAIDVASSDDGVVKGVGFQLCPGAVIYRRSIAKDVLGTDDPTVVQNALNTWDEFDQVASLAKDRGYYMIATTDAIYRIFANNMMSPWVNNNRLNIDSSIEDWLDRSKEYTDNSYTASNSSVWSEETFNEMFASGKSMCFFGPAWYFNFSMGNAQDPDKGCFGDWAICQGPQAWFWGGTWMLAATGTDNPTMVADIMNTFLNNETILTKLGKEDLTFVNNQKINSKLGIDSSLNNDFLGGQNDYKVMNEIAKNIKYRYATEYDSVFNTRFSEYAMDYLNGASSKEAAISGFKTYVKQRYPDLIVE